MIRLHSIVKVGSTYGKIAKKRIVTHHGKSHVQYLVVTKRGSKRWVFESNITPVW